MAKKEHSEFKAGLFALIAMCVGVGVLIWLGASEVLSPPKGRAVFYVDQGTGSLGLKAGDLVQVSDLPVGKIAEIRYDPEKKRTLYIARINHPDVKIHPDGKAQAVCGLVGAGALVVTDMGSEKALADEGDPALVSKGGMSLGIDRLCVAADTLNKIAEDLQKEIDTENDKAVLAKVHAIIDDLKVTSAAAVKIAANILAQTDVADKASLLAKVHRSAGDVNEITADLRTEVDASDKASLMSKVRRTAGNVEDMTIDAKPKVSGALTSVVNTTGMIEQYVKKDVAAILADLRKIDTELLAIVGNLKALTGKAKDLIVLNSDNIDEMVLNFTSMSANLNAAAKEIRRAPWRLVEKPTGERTRTQNIYDAARVFSEGAEELNGALARLTALRKARPEGVTAKDPELAKILEHVKASFDKFSSVEKALWDELKK